MKLFFQKIDSKVQFEEPDPDEVEMDAEDQEVADGPKDKKIRLSVSTESLQQSVADEEEEETTVVQEETPLSPLAEPEKPKAPPARKTRSVQKNSGTDEAPLQPQASVEAKPSKAVRKTRSVRTSAPKPEVSQQVGHQLIFSVGSFLCSRFLFGFSVEGTH